MKFKNFKGFSVVYIKMLVIGKCINVYVKNVPCNFQVFEELRI